jgi:hypothetical protein
MGLVILLVGVLLGAYLVLFSLANQQLFSLNLLAGQFLHEIPAWQLVITCLAVGLGIGLIFLIPIQVRAWGKVFSLKNELKRTKALLEEEQLHRPVEALPEIIEAEPEFEAKPEK